MCTQTSTHTRSPADAHSARYLARPQHQQTLISEVWHLLLNQASPLWMCVCVCMRAGRAQLRCSAQVKGKGWIVLLCCYSLPRMTQLKSVIKVFGSGVCSHHLLFRPASTTVNSCLHERCTRGYLRLRRDAVAGDGVERESGVSQLLYVDSALPA